MKTYCYGYPTLLDGQFLSSIKQFFSGKIGFTTLIQNRSKTEDKKDKILKKLVDEHCIETRLYELLTEQYFLFGFYANRNPTEFLNSIHEEHGVIRKRWFNTKTFYLSPDMSSEFYTIDAPNFLNPDSIPTNLRMSAIGPYSMAKLASNVPEEKFYDLLDNITDNLVALVSTTTAVHIHEPCLGEDVSDKDWFHVHEAYKRILEASDEVSVMVSSGTVNNIKELFKLPSHRVGLDVVYSKKNYENILKHAKLLKDKNLMIGVVSGLDVNKTDISNSLQKIIQIEKVCKNELIITHTGSLDGLPETTSTENPNIIENCSFAKEKLIELDIIKKRFLEEKFTEKEPQFLPTLTQFGGSSVVTGVRSKYCDIIEFDHLYPTQTVGHFPRNRLIKDLRHGYNTNNIGNLEFNASIKEHTTKVVKFQEALGLDVIGDGGYVVENETEYIAKKLTGVELPVNGWINTIGYEVYRAPIIVGDFTTKSRLFNKFTQLATKESDKIVKAITLGPVEFMMNSFLSTGLSLPSVVARYAMILREELNLAKAKRNIIFQINENSFTDLTCADKETQMKLQNWVATSFNLATFNFDHEIFIQLLSRNFLPFHLVEMFDEMNYDLIVVREYEDLKALSKVKYDRKIGFSIWKPGSDLILDVQEIKMLTGSFDKTQIWINPSDGLENVTVNYTKESLTGMIKRTETLRK